MFLGNGENMFPLHDQPIIGIGVDKSERNLTFGNRESIVQFEMMSAIKVRQTTRGGDSGRSGEAT